MKTPRLQRRTNVVITNYEAWVKVPAPRDVHKESPQTANPSIL